MVGPWIYLLLFKEFKIDQITTALPDDAAVGQGGWCGRNTPQQGVSGDRIAGLLTVKQLTNTIYFVILFKMEKIEQNNLMEKISLCKRRGFVFPAVKFMEV